MIRKRLGELLIEAGLLDEYQLQSALGHQRQWGGRVGQILVQMKLVDENRMVRVLATQLGVPMADPPPDDLHARIVAELSIDLVRQHHIFPLAIRRDPKGDQLALAMTDPTNVAAIDAVQFTTGKKVVPFLAGDSAIESWIRRHYHGERTVQPSGLASTVEQSSANLGVQFSGHTVDLAGPDDDDIPVVTGAMVAAAVAPPALPTVPPLAADPFAGLAPTPGTAAAVGTIPSARFAAVVPGVSTSAFAGTGIAALDPVVGEAAGAWDKHVEQAPTAALVVPLPTSAPVVAFGPSDGFLGGNDDDDAVAPPTSPAASPDPFAALLSTSAIPPAPPEAAPQPAPALPPPPTSEPVLELADLELTEAMPEAPSSAVDEAPAVPAGPSWGDLLDASPVDVAPAARAESNAFVRVPITADAFAPTVEELASASQAAPAPDVAANAAVAGPTCGRCGNPRVGAARFCPFCGLSFVESSVPVPVAVVEPAVVPFDGAPPVVASADQAAAVDDLDIGLVAVDEPVAPVVEAAPIDVAVAPVEDLDIGLVAVDVPTAPVEAAPVDVAAAPVEDLDIGLVAVDVPTAPVVEAAPIAAAPVEDLDIGLVAVDVAPVVDAAPLEIAPVETLDIGLVAVDVAPVVDAAPLDIAPIEALDIGLVAVDNAAPAAPVDAAPADDIDVDLVAVDDAAAVLASDLGDVGGNSFASQWADAAEQMIPRKETDRRNDVGWVPPSRELVVTPEPAAPAPEPLLAYRPAAPADSAPAAPAPWAVFAPALAVPPTPPEPPAPAAPAAPDAWVVGAAPTPNDVVDASTTPFTPAVGEAAVPDAVDDDVLVAADSDTVESIAPPAHIDDAPATLVADSVAHVPVAVVESAEPAPAALADDDLPSLDIDLDEAPAEAPVEAAPLPAPPPVASPSSLPAPAAEIGWGDLIDAPDAPVLPLISVPTFMPPATLTPPPMHLPRPPTLEALVAPPALSAPLVPPPPTWPVTSHDDDPFAPPLPPLDLEVMDTAAVPRTPTPRPQKVTATMVMKLDPAEQRRLLELLLASSDISTDALSTPPKPADGDPES